MEKRIDKLEERTAQMQARMNSHWAFQTDDEFVNSYLLKLRNELQSSIFKMAVGAIVLLAGSGFIFIKYAVNEHFNNQNEMLKNKLQTSYNQQIEKTDNNFEWRRFHDYGKNHVNLARIYSKAPLEEEVKETQVHDLLNEAEKYFKDALSHGEMHASTYWELGELDYSYPIEMGLKNEVDKLRAIQRYKDAISRYTEVEVSKGWRSEVFFRIGSVYLDLADDHGVREPLRAKYSSSASAYLKKAKNEYARHAYLTDNRSKGNVERISDLLAKIEGSQVN